MKNNLYLTGIAAAVLLSGTCIGTAQETKVKQSDLPPAVQKTVQEQSKGAVIRDFTTARENGKKTFEAEMMVNGHSKDIEIAEDGTLNEIETAVPFSSIPQSAQTALKTRAAGARITKVESLVKHGQSVAYEASTLKGLKRGEIQVAPDGSRLNREE